MHLSVQLQTETGHVMSRVDLGLPFRYLLNMTPSANTHCLQFIDPYGDTVFNGLQASVLFAELEAASTGVSEEAIALEHARQVAEFAGRSSVYAAPTLASVRAEARAAMSLAARCQDEMHTYVKFVGD